MAPITQIRAHVETADVGGAGSDSWIYLGVGGREFLLDLQGRSDTGRAADDTYYFGEGTNADNAEYNDPRKPQLDTDDLAHFPVYLRMETWAANRPGASNGFRSPSTPTAATPAATPTPPFAPTAKVAASGWTTGPARPCTCGPPAATRTEPAPHHHSARQATRDRLPHGLETRTDGRLPA
ncbi:hypothetical protein ACWGRF_07765 [Streptomyces zhihengii]